MSKKLTDIRKEIDSIDNQVHDLLMQRAALVSSVAAAKKKEGLQIVHPAREAKMMRRLLKRHKGVLPRSTVVNIWRELISSVSLLQTGLSVIVASNENTDTAPYWDMAKSYFGRVIPMHKVEGTQNAIAEVRDGNASFAVMPRPDLDEENPWWFHIFHQKSEDSLAVICALPYGQGNNKQESDSHQSGALIISKIDFMPSDDDVTFIALELSSDVSRARIMEHAEEEGLDLLNLFTGQNKHNPDVKIHLLEIQGYWTQSDKALSALQARFAEQCYSCKVIGGYPVIPDITQ